MSERKKEILEILSTFSEEGLKKVLHVPSIEQMYNNLPRKCICENCSEVDETAVTLIRLINMLYETDGVLFK